LRTGTFTESCIGIAGADATGLGVCVACATTLTGFFGFVERATAGVEVGAVVVRGELVASGVGEGVGLADGVGIAVGIALSVGVAMGAAVTLGVSTGDGNAAIALVSVFGAPPPKK
jgi:hypothetical protein